MKCEWKTVKIADLGQVMGGATPSTKDPKNYSGNIPWITPKDLSVFNGRFISQGERNITQKGLESCSTHILPKNSVLFSSRAPIGYMAIAANELCTNQGFKSVIPNSDTDYLFLYYLLQYNKEKIESMGSGTTFKEVSGSTMRNIEVSVPGLEMQKKVAKILSSLDDKIELNTAINHNLQQQVLAMYQKIFVDSPNDDRRICRADECFDISIGKTPPRKEAEWFKTVQADNIVWVSIADMGNCGLFIADSSEYLSPAAVKNFNVAIVPDNTVLLSFKLTVGRIAITDGWMTTNEAIAHFKTENKFINEYLYCYLKSYNFQTLGSTSSIATAVNSKIIKAMPFVVPTDDELAIFHNFAAPIFEKIKACQHENVQLTRLRDSLLPKLMNGEIDVSDVEI